MKKKNDKIILFVCTGNTCRSPMAEILLKAELKKRALKGFSVRSAGIAAKNGDVINPKSAEVLLENGLKIEDFHSTPLSGSLLKEAFAVVCMTEQHRDYLMEARWKLLREDGVENIENTVYSFLEMTGYDVLDPYGRDIDCYRYVFGLLQAGMSALIDKLRLAEYAEKTKPRAPKKPSDGAPKKRGRPKKTETENTEKNVAPKKRGRPKKSENNNKNT